MKKEGLTMKVKATGMFVLISMILNLFVISAVYADTASAAGDAKPMFVDKYDYEALTSNTISYDFNFDGSIDTLSTTVYSVYSDEIGDHCGRYEFIINGVTHHICDMRHGHFKYLYVTDIDQTDNYLDIVLVNWYKGAGAEIYRYNGSSLIEVTSDYYFSVWNNYWEDTRNTGILDPPVDMVVSNSSTGVIGFSFLCSNECHSYIKQSENYYVETDISIADYVNNTESFTDAGITVMINGKEVTPIQPPIIVNDTTLVHIRTFEEIGAAVAWESDTQTAVVIKGNKVIRAKIGENALNINGVDSQFIGLASVQLVNDCTMVPIRVITEAMGGVVNWDGETRTVDIQYNDGIN